MSEPSPRYRWILPSVIDPSPELLSGADSRGISRRLLDVLAARGHLDGTALAALFDDPVAALHPPNLLPGASAFKERIEIARRRNEGILVFGDFDADGLTGLAILVRSLRQQGLDVVPHVPRRLEEGHGLSLAAVERARAEARSVIVTVDCGISSVAEVRAAVASGIDVLITDHHRIPDVLPPAVVIVDPHLAGSRYPNTHLSGSGVAFKLAHLLAGDDPSLVDAALAMADLAAVGSIADVVPLIGENRAIVRLGLARLAVSPSAGLAALLRQAGVAPDRLDLDSIGYAIAPRLNAVGRMGDADAAASLLLTDDPAEAERLAATLQSANLQRRELTATVLAEARLLAAAEPPDAPLTMIVGEWPVGIIGLVAGRLADESGRPAVVVSSMGEPWRASARSAAGFDLATAFQVIGDVFERYGGHAAAAGCSLPADRYPEFRRRLMDLAAALPRADPRPSLRLDIVARAESVDYVLLREMARLDGSGDAPPLVGISGLQVARVRPAKGGHLQLTLRKGREVIDGICFGREEDLSGTLREGQAL
ncbi:MAG: single-stranded-DNA-specific exonuclease RecJ, partial [Chloroflexota bacterium]|nr:single-stranded-DNA-specific exonuclease RecJ [Chloroflexota bacterium]